MRRILSVLLALALCLALPCPAGAEDAAPLTAEQRESLRSALCEADIPSLRRALDLGVLSSEELTAYYLERIEAYNRDYNCFITLCDNALAEARKRDEAMAAGEAGGILFGIPIVVKDNIHYAGYPTTNGLRLSDTPLSTENAEIVDLLLRQGAVILGKTNMSTKAQDAKISLSLAAGETKNAYGLNLASGGSSGGSAVAVSLNFAAAALGTDTNSSLRYPAALNGCVALRPTKGLVPREGVIKLNGARDTPGAITRTVYDQAILLDVLTGGSYAENLNGNILDGLRLGVLTELTEPQGFDGRTAANMDPEIAAAFDRAVEELTACGAEVVEVSMPELFAMSEATFDDYAAMDSLSGYLDRTLAENNVAALLYPAYLSAPLFTGVDGQGKPVDVESQTYITNVRTLAPCAKAPEITVPMGTHSRGAGMALEIVSSRNSEQLLLDIAYAYTREYDHRVAPAGAPDLHGGAGVTLAQWLDDYEASLVPPETEPEPIPEPEPGPGPEVPPPEPAPPTGEVPPPPVPEEAAKLVPPGRIVLTAAAVFLAAVIPPLLWKLRKKRRALSSK